MKEKGVEVSAKTVDEAIDKGLAELGLNRNQVRIETLAAGKPGLFGIGGEDARVRLIPVEEGAFPSSSFEIESEESAAQVKSLDAPEVQAAADYLKEIVRLLDLDAEVTVRAPETPGDGKGRASAVFDVSGDDLAILIGRRGVTLAALQYLVNVIANRQGDGKTMITVDVERYRRRREDALRGLAQRMADRVRQSGRSITLEPMPPSERRIVHITLANNDAVSTSSIGDGERRKVVIAPRRRGYQRPGGTAAER
ncbi:MAG TPA: RNA-binding cell elongation regulator Jag/EloR [Dehalococcoidia bacterium]|nr:RNA-binding cell elongation regulator Jag/EloR [Dehalococcoidia bacterium]